MPDDQPGPTAKRSGHEAISSLTLWRSYTQTHNILQNPPENTMQAVLKQSGLRFEKS